MRENGLRVVSLEDTCVVACKQRSLLPFYVGPRGLKQEMRTKCVDQPPRGDEYKERAQDLQPGRDSAVRRRRRSIGSACARAKDCGRDELQMLQLANGVRDGHFGQVGLLSSDSWWFRYPSYKGLG